MIPIELCSRGPAETLEFGEVAYHPETGSLLIAGGIRSNDDGGAQFTGSEVGSYQVGSISGLAIKIAGTRFIVDPRDVTDMRKLGGAGAALVSANEFLMIAYRLPHLPSPFMVRVAKNPDKGQGQAIAFRTWSLVAGSEQNPYVLIGVKDGEVSLFP